MKKTISTINNQPTLAPDQLISGIRLMQPSEQINVRGRVTRLSQPYPVNSPKWVYGNIIGNDVSISFRCPADHAPDNEGEFIVLSGFLRIRPSNIHDGLQIELDGVPVGQWELEYTAEKPARVKREKPKLALEVFISQDQLQGMLVVGTQRGLSDYQTPLLNKGINISWSSRICNFANQEILIKELKLAVTRFKPTGIVFIRGGSDSGKTLDIWDDSTLIKQILDLKLPFYTAIGHADKLLLADQYADESFSTPTDFGHRLADSILKSQAEQVLSTENDRLQDNNHKLQGVIESKNRKIQNLRIVNVLMIILITASLILFIVA